MKLYYLEQVQIAGKAGFFSFWLATSLNANERYPWLLCPWSRHLWWSYFPDLTVIHSRLLEFLSGAAPAAKHLQHTPYYRRPCLVIVCKHDVIHEPGTRACITYRDVAKGGPIHSHNTQRKFGDVWNVVFKISERTRHADIQRRWLQYSVGTCTRGEIANESTSCLTQSVDYRCTR